ncbi:MAG: hypothetical protein SA339_02500 [Methanomassiliicoccus sp.]|nr:hypothetical protein [Methanomassiliicoccus sp.]
MAEEHFSMADGWAMTLAVLPSRITEISAKAMIGRTKLALDVNFPQKDILSLK